MLYHLKLYGIMLASFLAIDLIWLDFVAKPFYKKQLSAWLAPHPNWTAALIFYALFVLGVLVFVTLPGIASNSIKNTLALGLFFGVVTYATYDLTNLAVIKNWPLSVSLVDILWGGCISMIVSAIGYWAK